MGPFERPERPVSYRSTNFIPTDTFTPRNIRQQTGEVVYEAAKADDRPVEAESPRGVPYMLESCNVGLVSLQQAVEELVRRLDPVYNKDKADKAAYIIDRGAMPESTPAAVSMLETISFRIKEAVLALRMATAAVEV